MGRRPDDAGDAAEDFAGDLFLYLADKGLLVVDPEHAERVIAELDRTLDIVKARLRRREIARRLRAAAGADIAPGVAKLAVDAAFAEQVTAGHWDQALIELPKYIEAFRIAARRARERP
ncbi:hypothetical protein [Actinokineospora iranica]|uniref:Uncharacterized protein n=1 Tax=Actinokineospora iranica TaxID=1271860 RepID=A0A1G6XCF6_9PSEU|nr:hypothetical protein [Actinokineospora iranica]SDD75473.1 hypothetical protein SAMN05216174_11715 [Actinokineospora iranica]